MKQKLVNLGHTLRGERGQVLPILVLVLVSLIGMLGLAIDAGRLYLARAELSRALDAAALAGVVELPDTMAAQDKATVYFNDHEPDGTISFPASGASEFRVAGARNVEFLFMRVLGFSGMDVTASAAAGAGSVPLDVYLTLDATGSMHTGCNDAETTTGGACPIKEARDAAKGFVSTLLGSGTPSGYTAIGTGAFRGCYNPPRSNTKCIDGSPPGSMITPLTSNAATLNAGIDTIRAIGATGQPSGGSGTNVCLALKKGLEVLTGAGAHTAANTMRALVVLSDGDNVYNAGEVYSNSPESPQTPCRPTNPSTSDGNVGRNCLSSTQSQESKLDTLTKSMADTLKAQNIEIYVVAFGLCGSDSAIPTASYCNQIGNGNGDSTADQRLLKCIASSTSGTNDHYFAVPTAADLPGVFQQIAQTLSFRLTE